MMRLYLDAVAARLLGQKRGRRFDLRRARLILGEVIRQEHGLTSFKFLKRQDEQILIQYFDSHDRFERVSDVPEWQPKAIRR